MEQYGIRFVTISPDQLSASTLANLIRKYELAVLSEYKKSDASSMSKEHYIVALTSIEDNCTFLKFFVPYALSACALFVSSLPQSNYSNYGSASKNSRDFIHEVININSTYNTSAELIRITEGTPEVVSSLSFKDNDIFNEYMVKSTSTMYGIITTVGGKQQPKVKVSFDNGQTIACDIKYKNLVYEAARLLYKTVSVKGTSSSVMFSGITRIVDFEIEAITEFIPLKPCDFIKKISPLVKHQLDRISDIEGFFSRIRED